MNSHVGSVAPFAPWFERMPAREYCWLLVLQVLGESMAGISQNAKTGDLPAFGECVGIASKALCGLTEAAAQVRDGGPCPAVRLCPVPDCGNARPVWEASAPIHLLPQHHGKGRGSCAGWALYTKPQPSPLGAEQPGKEQDALSTADPAGGFRALRPCVHL